MRFFSAFSILAGLLIVVSSVYATRLARVQEAAYYKVLGAKSYLGDRRFCAGEHPAWLAECGAGAAHGAGGRLADHEYLFKLEYQFLPGPSLAMVGITVGLVLLVGMVAATGILRSRPINFLRLQTENE